MKATREEVVEFIAPRFPQTRCATSFPVHRRYFTRSASRCGALRGHLGEIGIVPLTVTTSLTINFLRKPAADRGIVGQCGLLKRGKSLVVGEVSLYSEGLSEPVAHVVGTYSIPPQTN
jgi:acyl-coenzyme A thioesterase PaaI-like protein